VVPKLSCQPQLTILHGQQEADDAERTQASQDAPKDHSAPPLFLPLRLPLRRYAAVER
jgi:hypothetical protein